LNDLAHPGIKRINTDPTSTYNPDGEESDAPDAEPSEPEADGEPAELVAGGPGELVAEPTEPTPGQVILCAPPVQSVACCDEQSLFQRERKVEIKAA
jgi:hypothetical protein